MGGANDKQEAAAAAAADAALAEATAKADEPDEPSSEAPADQPDEELADEPNLVPLDFVRVEFVERWTFQVGTADGVTQVEYNAADVAEVASDVAALAIGHGRARPTKKKVTAR